MQFLSKVIFHVISQHSVMPQCRHWGSMNNWLCLCFDLWSPFNGQWAAICRDFVVWRKKWSSNLIDFVNFADPWEKSMFGDFLTSLDSFYFREHFHRRYDAGYYVSHKNWSNFRCGTKRQRLLRQSLSLSLFLTLINLWTLRLEMINFFFSAPREKPH